MRSNLRWIFSWLIVGVFLVSCAPASPQVAPTQMEEEQPQESENATDEPASVQSVILNVWDFWVRDEETKVIEALNKEFEAQHPGVTINRTVKSFDDMKATIKLAFSSSDGPDVGMVNQGLSDMGALVKADLLVDLTPYLEKYQWDKRISAGVIMRNSFSADGSKFGEGNLYGVGSTAELIGVIYRKDIFKELGLSVPKTLAEFEAIMEDLKANGHTPIVFGNLGGMASSHVYADLLNEFLPDRNYLDNLIYGREDQSWDTQEVIKAATLLQDWVKAGYFTEGFAGISYDDQQSLFESDQGAMMITGSWWSSTFAAGPKGDQLGFFLLPPVDKGAYKMSVGGTSTAYTIRKGSPNQDLAAEYVDWMISDVAAEAWANAGTVPTSPVDPEKVPEEVLFGDFVAGWNEINQKDEVGHYLDWSTPTFYDTIMGSLEQLMALKLTPEEFAQKLEADYAAYLNSK